MIEATFGFMAQFVVAAMIVLLGLCLIALAVAVPILIVREARKPRSLHYWEMTSNPVNTPDVWDGATHRWQTHWHERCFACGETRITKIWGKWDLEELTGERTLGSAKPVN